MCEHLRHQLENLHLQWLVLAVIQVFNALVRDKILRVIWGAGDSSLGYANAYAHMAAAPIYYFECGCNICRDRGQATVVLPVHSEALRSSASRARILGLFVFVSLDYFSSFEMDVDGASVLMDAALVAIGALQVHLTRNPGSGASLETSPWRAAVSAVDSRLHVNDAAQHRSSAPFAVEQHLDSQSPLGISSLPSEHVQLILRQCSLRTLSKLECALFSCQTVSELLS